MIHIEYRVTCDGCGFQGTTEVVSAYLNNAMGDGPWYSSPVRTICYGCRLDRACRIFGHAIVRQPAALGGRLACTRCDRFIIVGGGLVSTESIAFDGNRVDREGNPFDPADCPCCQGAMTYDTGALCDACLVAGIEGRYPHGCARDGAS